MKTIWQRLKIYARLGWQMGTYSLLGLVWFVTFHVFVGTMAPRLGYLTMHRAIANDSPCFNPECDFSAFWPAGFLARAHAYGQIYQPERFLFWQRHILFADAQRAAFFYPPQMLLPSALISHLPFEQGFFVWTAVWVAISILLLRWVRLSWVVILLSLLSPADLWNMELGQLGLIGDTLLVAGLLALMESPRQAGGLLGLLACKPQIGILVPIVLLVQRGWRGLFSFVLMGGFLTLLTLMTFGWAVWPAYFVAGRRESAQVLNAVFSSTSYQNSGVSVFWMLRSFHAGLAVSYAVQAVSILGAMLLTCWVWRQVNLSRIDRMALTVFLSLLATPYGYTDDMVAWSIALAALAERRGWRIDLLDVLFWLWPMLCTGVVMRTGILFTPFVVVLAVGRTWVRAGLPVPHLPIRAAVLPRA